MGKKRTRMEMQKGTLNQKEKGKERDIEKEKEEEEFVVENETLNLNENESGNEKIIIDDPVTQTSLVSGNMVECVDDISLLFSRKFSNGRKQNVRSKKNSNWVDNLRIRRIESRNNKDNTGKGREKPLIPYRPDWLNMFVGNYGELEDEDFSELEYEEELEAAELEEELEEGVEDVRMNENVLNDKLKKDFEEFKKIYSTFCEGVLALFFTITVNLKFIHKTGVPKRKVSAYFPNGTSLSRKFQPFRLLMHLWRYDVDAYNKLCSFAEVSKELMKKRDQTWMNKVAVFRSDASMDWGREYVKQAELKAEELSAIIKKKGITMGKQVLISGFLVQTTIPKFLFGRTADPDEVMLQLYQTADTVISNESFFSSKNPVKEYFFRKLNQSFKIPDRHLVGGQLLGILHAAAIRFMRIELRKAPGFSISFDSWTSFSGNSLVAVTYRFMDEKHNVQEFLLDALPLNKSHSTSYLSSSIINRMNFHTSDDQLLFSSTTDGESAVHKASKFLCSNLSEMSRCVEETRKFMPAELHGSTYAAVHRISEIVVDKDNAEVDRAIHCVPHNLGLVSF